MEVGTMEEVLVQLIQEIGTSVLSWEFLLIW